MPKPIKSPSNVSAATKGIAFSAVSVAIEVAMEIAKLVIDAIASDDPKTLKKVTDILPAGHKLRSEITYAVEMERLRKRLESGAK